ncbi:DUF1653 domain-containing protein [Salinimonas iocasae]|uniref:DUF1653 domain-containing protein n=1 Tax=Salinimonas iocasae TaxID=2572577 RepID=A0A5B7Y9L2_9ALTE|nr:DUF1653 domain-containing protein [Salinimonas iocasae]QCZ92467.1 DUF1653 domain-containing protein [Salinimonas iocasae]
MESIIKPGIYLHYKGQYYRVYEVARHSEDESLYVVYRPEYGEKSLWIRPLSMFCETVEVNGERMPRFSYVKPLEDG